MTYTTWRRKFAPKSHPLSDTAAYDNCLIDDYEKPEIQAYLNRFPAANIWTMIAEGEDTYMLSGYHFVNRMGFIVTVIPNYDDGIVVEMGR